MSTPNHELARVLVHDETDDIEYELYAKIIRDVPNFKFMEAILLENTEEFYKGAEIYLFDETKIETIDYDSVIEFYTTPFPSMTHLHSNQYVFTDEIDSGSESDGDSLDSFVVPDELETALCRPSDAHEIDAHWDAWTPGTSGQTRFKQTIDNIERIIKQTVDEKNNFKQ
jgi:hypothetical protein